MHQKKALLGLHEDTKPVEDISNLPQKILKFVQSKHKKAMPNLDLR